MEPHSESGRSHGNTRDRVPDAFMPWGRSRPCEVRREGCWHDGVPPRHWDFPQTLLLHPDQSLARAALHPCYPHAASLPPRGGELGAAKKGCVADLENKLMVTGEDGGEGGREGIVREFEIDMYTPLYFKWISNKDLMCSTGNSAQCPVAAWMGGESGGEWVPVYVWLRPFAVYLKLSQHCYWAMRTCVLSCFSRV